MMVSRKNLAVLALLFIFIQDGQAFEPELFSEISVRGRTISGDILNGRLILKSQEKFWVLTPEGKEVGQTNLKPNQGLVTSADGRFFGITTYSKGASPGFLATERFELYSAEGNKLWEIQNPPVSDFYISNQAKVVVGLGGERGGENSCLIFYNDVGDSIRSIKVAFPQGVSFSSNGKYVLVNSGTDGLWAYDDSGNLKANFGPSEKFSVSSNGEWVVTVNRGTLRFFYQSKPTHVSPRINLLVREMSFSPDNRYLGVIDKKNLYLFEVKTGILVWQYTLEKPELSFISLDLSVNREKIVAGIDLDKGRKVALEERHTTGWIYLFDKDGRISWQKKLSYKLWGASFPSVRFSTDGTKFSVITRERIYLFKNPLK